MKAIALMSGGLDSVLAAKLIIDQGIEVIGLHFVLPISSVDPEENAGLRSTLEECEALGIECKVYQFGEEYFELLLDPKHGHGGAVNPCIDCHALMLRVAKGMMDDLGASFVITGEVLGQRPMSQMREKLIIVARESGLDGLLLRPMSAKHLDETIPEKEGWVDREKLMGIEGRRRREQMDLAKKVGVDYMSPAGGCLLTEKHFAVRFREHVKYSKLDMSDFPLLKIGRHFRLPDESKLVVGRNEPENKKLESLFKEGDRLFVPKSEVGPSAILRGGSQLEDTIKLAGELLASYCDGDGAVQLSVTEFGQDEKAIVAAERHERAEFSQYSIQ